MTKKFTELTKDVSPARRWRIEEIKDCVQAQMEADPARSSEVYKRQMALAEKYIVRYHDMLRRLADK